MVLISKTDLIKMMDEMSIEETRTIINETKQKNGYVSYRAIFETMGYVHSFNEYYKKA